MLYAYVAGVGAFSACVCVCVVLCVRVWCVVCVVCVCVCSVCGVCMCGGVLVRVTEIEEEFVSHACIVHFSWCDVQVGQHQNVLE